MAQGYVYSGTGRNRKFVRDSNGNPVRSGKVEKEEPKKQLTPEEQEAGRQQWNSLVDAGVVPAGLYVGKDGSLGKTNVIKPAAVKEENSVVGDTDTVYQDAILKAAAKKITETFEGNTLPLPNELEKFASINHIFSFGCISNAELNFLDKTYRVNGLRAGQQVLRSGGIGNKKPRTYAEKVYGTDTEYFIDEVEIGTYIAPNPKSRGTNFFQISFKVTEPYSMGQLLQTMQICARNAGHQNYLESPWLLILETIGYDDNQNIIQGPKRIFPMKVVSVNFNVTTEGAVYDFVCSAFNDEAFTDQAQGLMVNVNISGRTVEEILQSGLNSLSTAINTAKLNAQKESKNPKIDTDEYIIIFPKEQASKDFANEFGTTDTSAKIGDIAQKEFTDEQLDDALTTADTTLANLMDDTGRKYVTKFAKKKFVENQLGFSVERSNLSEALKKKFTGIGGEVNEIGTQKILTKDSLSPGNMNFGLSQFAYNKDTNIIERQGVKIDKTGRSIQFRAGTKIQKIIEEIVLLSDYGNKITDKGVTAKPNGMIDWFRIQSNVFQLDSPEHESVYGRPPRIYVFRVTPYEVHKSVFQMPNDPPPGYAELEKEAVKHYNYMYTGQNKDILEFDLQFNNAFYAAISSANNALSTKASEKGKDKKETEYEATGEIKTQYNEAQKALHDNAPSNSESGGATAEGPEQRIARAFNEAVMNSDADLITGTMTIMGDPYFLADSGVGNFNSEATKFLNLNADGSMNHSSSQVDILINFRTPLDITQQGPQFAGSAIGVKDFSGLYQVISVNNSFRQNEFTQELQMVRRKNYQMKDAQTLITEKQQEVKKKYDAALAAAKKDGNKYDVAFAKADKNADGKLTLAEEREFATLVGVDSDEFKNAKIKATGQADEARAKDKEAKKKAELDAKNKQIESTGGGNLRLNSDGTTRGRGL